MNTRSRANPKTFRDLAILLAIWPMVGIAQVPVDENGNPIGEFSEYGEPGATTSDADIPLASTAELETLVGPVALYPDDLLAIVLPASTFPLQIVEASRFLEELETNPSLQPDDDWDDSVVALTNYPEVIELLNSDLDWTWKLGEAVVAQQADVIAAIEVFRDRAYAAGNLQSDEHQNVTQEDGIIEISPVSEDIIYVPYYEPERVVVYQPRPVYYYYPRAYPVYYYPYSYGHSFNDGYFWGVTTAFTIGWATDYLHVYHHSYYGHPYYGYTYNNNWWYRRPSINIYNNYYVNNRHNWSNNRYQHGDRWYAHNSRRLNRSDQRVTRTRYLPSNNTHVARNTLSNGFAPSADRMDRSGGTRNRNTQPQPARDNVRNGSTNASGSNTVTNRQNDRDTSASPRRQPAARTTGSKLSNDVTFRTRSGNPTVGREFQERSGTNTRVRDSADVVANRSSTNRSSTNRSSTNRSSTNRTATRSAPAPGISFAPRNNERSAVSSRDQSKRYLGTPTSATSGTRNTIVARQSSIAARKSTNNQNREQNATTSRSVASSRVAPSRVESTRVASSRSSSTARVQSTQRAQRSAPSRPQQQRQSAPRQQASQSGNNQSRSSSKSESGSGSRSNSRGNNNSRSDNRRLDKK